jgi:hypothetical protein
VCWQATTVALFGIVVGIPLGLAAGQLVWRTFATNLGAVPVATVPVWLIASLGRGRPSRWPSILAIAPAAGGDAIDNYGQLPRSNGLSKRVPAPGRRRIRSLRGSSGSPSPSLDARPEHLDRLYGLGPVQPHARAHV